MRGAGLQLLAWWAAFWIALGLFARAEARRAERLRCALGLVLGALAAHGGWALLQVPVEPPRLADLSRGYAVLFVPLGLLLAAPRGPAREAFLAAALPSLPLALAVARLGCLAAGCCHGVATRLPWGLPEPAGPSLHPTAAYEGAGLVLLHAALRRLPRRGKAPAALAGLALVRLLGEPLRAPPALGAPRIGVAPLGAALGAVALLMALRSAPAPPATPSAVAGRERRAPWPERPSPRPAPPRGRPAAGSRTSSPTPRSCC